MAGPIFVVREGDGAPDWPLTQEKTADEEGGRRVLLAGLSLLSGPAVCSPFLSAVPTTRVETEHSKLTHDH